MSQTTIVIRIDMPPKGIEVTGEGSSPTDAQMKAEAKARQHFLDFVEPKLAALPGQPPRRSGNVLGVELLGTDVWSELNHYLVMIAVDIGSPAVDFATLAPHGAKVEVIGSY